MADEPQTLEELIDAIHAGRIACALDPATLGIRLGIVDGLDKAYHQAQNNYYRVHGMLMAVVIQAAPDWVLEERKLGREPQNYSPADLYQIIRDRLEKLLLEASANFVKRDSAVASLEVKIKALTAQLESGNKALATQYQSEKDTLLAEINSLQDQLAAATTLASRVQQAASASADGGAEPDFYLRWKAGKHFQREAAALRLMGESGLARSPEIRKRLGTELGVEPNSRVIVDSLSALVENGFADDVALADAGLNGRPPNLLQLTKLGQAAYSLLTNKPPQPSEWELKKYHKTDAHTLLNLAARDWLRKAGYTIVQDAPVLEANGEKFNPDIAASKDGELIYVEVETQAEKGKQDSDAKWLRFARFSGGKMYVICENSTAGNKVLRDIGIALGSTRSNSVVVHICNLSKMTEETLSSSGLWAR